MTQKANRPESPKEEVSFPLADWPNTPRLMQDFVLHLLAEIDELSQENQHLREQLNQHSGNSSRPPSSDQPQHSPPVEETEPETASAPKTGKRKQGTQRVAGFLVIPFTVIRPHNELARGYRHHGTEARVADLTKGLPR